MDILNNLLDREPIVSRVNPTQIKLNYRASPCRATTNMSTCALLKVHFLSEMGVVMMSFPGPIKVHFLLEMGVVMMSLPGPIKVHFLLEMGVVTMSLPGPIKVHFLSEKEIIIIRNTLR